MEMKVGGIEDWGEEGQRAERRENEHECQSRDPRCAQSCAVICKSPFAAVASLRLTEIESLDSVASKTVFQRWDQSFMSDSPAMP